MYPRTNGLITIDILKQRLYHSDHLGSTDAPSEPVITFTLKSVSTSKAEELQRLEADDYWTFR